MKQFIEIRVGILLAVLSCVCWSESLFAQAAATQPAANQIRIVELQGKVEFSPAGATTWVVIQTNLALKPFDRLRTGQNSRVGLRWCDQSVIPIGASTELEILPPRSANEESGLHLVRGILSFFHRDQPGRIRIITRGATAGVEGTEFILAVNDSDRTILSVVDGKVRFENERASLILTNGQQAVADPGQAPIQTAGFIANNLLQWCFYYPAVLDPADLTLSADEQSALADSLAAYRSGDLLNALAKYPAARQPGSDAERVYYAALVLSVGQVDQAEATLASLSAADASARPQRLASALRQLIAAVKHAPTSSTLNPQLSTELLAASYYEQSRGIREASLESALNLARQATVKSPEFGFGWTRLAELEFSFGHTRKALAALEQGLKLTPRNAQALALKGFLLAAENNTAEAIGWFDRALAVDSALGNAWLGRGLCRIRRGDTQSGREDLLIAAALEPQRAELRNYLGKAYGNDGDYPHAEKELQLAKKLDPNDPTPWLYSALINHENNRVNDAIRDLEKSTQLNDNRSVYRSQLLLDQDNAVRSANLAALYRDAGMFDVSVREASRAVSYDYANYSAHSFLQNSYHEQRTRNPYSNQRFETPEFAEYLVASLLAPVSAGPLSSAVSQQEYSKLFERDRIGFYSETEYLSRGAWQQDFAQYGTFEKFNYSLEGSYTSDPGLRRNSDLENKFLCLALKQQVTPQDSVNFNVSVAEMRQAYDPAQMRAKETQYPNLTLGYHHEWNPGVHTLILLGRMEDTYSINNPNSGGRMVNTYANEIQAVRTFMDSEVMRLSQELYSSEIQQIFQQADHTTVIGSLFQHSDLNNKLVANAPSIVDLWALGPTIASQDLDTEFDRFSVYGYHSWQILDPLLLVGGLSYDRLFLPQNRNSTPFSDLQTTKDQISPKAGLIWTPVTNTTVRAAYTRSMGGVSLDQNFRLEPTQVAGLNQSFRHLISESVAAANGGASFETYGLSIEQKYSTGTYLGLAGELLSSQERFRRGTYLWDANLDDPWIAVSNQGLKEHLDYRERSIVFTADQLLDKEWAVGLRYRLTQAEFDDSFPEVPNLPPEQFDPGFERRQHLESLLHQLNLHANFNHASGVFASFEALWFLQENTSDLSGQPGDDLWQFNLVGGYRFFHRRAKLEVGVLNLTDRDYRLHPLTMLQEMPCERTFVTRLQLNF